MDSHSFIISPFKVSWSIGLERWELNPFGLGVPLGILLIPLSTLLKCSPNSFGLFIPLG